MFKNTTLDPPGLSAGRDEVTIYAGPVQGPRVTFEPPKVPADTGSALNGQNPSRPRKSEAREIASGTPVSRICRNCSRRPVTSPKQSRCNSCLALSRRKRRASAIQPTGNRSTTVSSEKTCARCGTPFTPRGRSRRCDDCRLAVDPKTSQCPFCLAIYPSHDDCRAGVAVRMHHARKACIA